MVGTHGIVYTYFIQHHLLKIVKNLINDISFPYMEYVHFIYIFKFNSLKLLMLLCY